MLLFVLLFTSVVEYSSLFCLRLRQYKKTKMPPTTRAEKTEAKARMRSFWELCLGFSGERGRMREEMLAGKEAKLAGEGGGGGEG